MDWTLTWVNWDTVALGLSACLEFEISLVVPTTLGPPTVAQFGCSGDWYSEVAPDHCVYYAVYMVIQIICMTILLKLWEETQ